MSVGWAGAPVGSDPSSQATAQKAMADAMANAMPPSAATGGISRGTQASSTAGQYQTGPVSREEYATGTYAAFDPTGWTRQGGNSDTDVYVNDKTGAVAYVGKDGRVEDTFGSWAESNAAGLTPIGAVKQLVNGAEGVVKDAVGSIVPNINLGAPIGSLPQNVTDPMQQAIARQAAIADQMGANYQNFTPTGAPNIAQPAAIQAAMAGQVNPIQAAMASQTGPIQAAMAQSQLAQAAQQGQTSLSTAAQMDLANQAEMRAAQQGLIGGLQNAIAGKEPSVAEIMLRNATDRNVANQYGLAQAANGMNTGLAQRTAMINSAEMNQNAIMQQAILRAQEIAANRGMLGSALEQARGADIGLASNQATLQQQANLANQAAQNTTYQTNAQLQQGANLQNAQLATQANLANANNQTSANTSSAQLANAVNLANANNQTSANTSSAQLANAVNLANAGNQSQANLTTGQLQTQASIANANNQVSTNALNQKAQQDLAANQLTAAGQAGQTSVGQADTYAKLADAEAKRQAALAGAGGSILAGLLS